jgi:hypothetical protein
MKFQSETGEYVQFHSGYVKVHSETKGGVKFQSETKGGREVSI